MHSHFCFGIEIGESMKKLVLLLYFLAVLGCAFADEIVIYEKEYFTVEPNVLSIEIGDYIPEPFSVDVSGCKHYTVSNLKEGINKYNSDIDLKLVTSSKSANSTYEVLNNIIYIKQSSYKIGSQFISNYPIRIKHFLKLSNLF